MEAPPYSAAAVDVVRLPDGRSERDHVAVEEPLEIRIGGLPVAVTMRTPGHDEELALGFCLSEGLKPRGARLPDDLAANTVDVEASGFDPARLQRSFYTTSSCGVCGKGALEAVAVEAARVEAQLRVPLAVVVELPERLRDAQAAFAVTGTALVAVVMALGNLAFWLYAQNAVTAAAQEAAVVVSREDGTPQAGQRTARALLAASLGPGAEHVTTIDILVWVQARQKIQQDGRQRHLPGP